MLYIALALLCCFSSHFKILRLHLCFEYRCEISRFLCLSALHLKHSCSFSRQPQLRQSLRTEVICLSCVVAQSDSSSVASVCLIACTALQPTLVWMSSATGDFWTWAEARLDPGPSLDPDKLWQMVFLHLAVFSFLAGELCILAALSKILFILQFMLRSYWCFCDVCLGISVHATYRGYMTVGERVFIVFSASLLYVFLSRVHGGRVVRSTS